eukprot:5853530-Amphidinium_carterae.1
MMQPGFDFKPLRVLVIAAQIALSRKSPSGRSSTISQNDPLVLGLLRARYRIPSYCAVTIACQCLPGNS